MRWISVILFLRLLTPHMFELMMDSARLFEHFRTPNCLIKRFIAKSSFGNLCGCFVWSSIVRLRSEQWYSLFNILPWTATSITKAFSQLATRHYSFVRITKEQTISQPINMISIPFDLKTGYYASEIIAKWTDTHNWRIPIERNR